MKKNVWIAGMTAILSAGLVWAAPVFTLADERIPDGVSVGAVSLSGLTEEEAEKQIESYVNEKLNMSAVNNQRTLSMIVHRQFKNPSVVEMQFVGLKYLKLFPSDENYTCEILDATMILKGYRKRI